MVRRFVSAGAGGYAAGESAEEFLFGRGAGEFVVGADTVDGVCMVRLDGFQSGFEGVGDGVRVGDAIRVRYRRARGSRS